MQIYESIFFGEVHEVDEVHVPGSEGSGTRGRPWTICNDPWGSLLSIKVSSIVSYSLSPLVLSPSSVHVGQT